MRNRLSFAVIAFFLTTTFASAMVKYDATARILYIYGPTTNSLAMQVANELTTKSVGTIVMAGPGGNFHAGLLLGKSIKKSGARVIIPEGQECFSACAFSAIAAGSKLLVDGTLGFHRPYLNSISPQLSAEEYARGAGGAYIEMTHYLVTMGFPIIFSHAIKRPKDSCGVHISTPQPPVDLRILAIAKNHEKKQKITSNSFLKKKFS